MKNKRNKRNKRKKSKIKFLEFVGYSSLGIIITIFETIIWVVKNIGKFLYSIPEESNRIYGMVRFTASFFLTMVFCDEQNGTELHRGEEIRSFFKSFLGNEWGGTIFYAVAFALFLSLLICFLAMIGMNTGNSEGYVYSNKYVNSNSDSGEYPRLNRMLKNLDAQFTDGARASDLFKYLKDKS